MNSCIEDMCLIKSIKIRFISKTIIYKIIIDYGIMSIRGVIMSIIYDWAELEWNNSLLIQNKITVESKSL